MHETYLDRKSLGRRVKACYQQLSSRSEKRPLLIFSTGTTQMLHLVLDLQREAVLPWNNKLKEKPKAGRGQPTCSGWYIPCLCVTLIFCSLLNSRASARETLNVKTSLTSWKEMPLSTQTWADRAFLHIPLLSQAREREISFDVLKYLKAMWGTWEK